MMIDGIPAPGPSIFTKRTLLWRLLFFCFGEVSKQDPTCDLDRFRTQKMICHTVDWAKMGLHARWDRSIRKGLGLNNWQFAKNQGKHGGLRVHVGSEGDRKRLSKCPEQHAIWPRSAVHDPSLQ